jgi:cytidylate kinase
MGVITISRQIGSLGDEVAAKVADKLGYELMDTEKIHKLALNCDESYKDACQMYEKEEAHSFWDRFFFNSPANASLFQSLNFELAAKGNVVILGRGAQAVLKNIPGVFKARIIAPLDVKIERVKKAQGLDDKAASRFINWHDKQRRNLMQTTLEYDISDNTLYDLLLNTKGYDLEAATEVVLLAAQKVLDSGAIDSQSDLLARRALEKKIETHIRRELVFPYHSTLVLKLDSENVLHLNGLVSDPESKQKAEAIGKKYDGVKAVENNLSVTSFSY